MKNNKLLLEKISLLACPDCFGNLQIKNDSKIICLSCQRKFEIIDGIPILIPSNFSNELLLAIKSFGIEYKELMKKGDYSYDDKYSQKDVEIIIEEGGNFESYLELGCGRGRNCIILAKKGINNVIGIDVSIDALILAKKISAKEGVDPFFVCCDMANLPFRKDVFDVCFGGGSLEHFKKTEKVIAQIFGVLKKNGVSIMTVPCVSLATCIQGILTGNIPKIFPLKQIYFFIHYKILRKKFLMFGFEYSFLPKKIKKEFKCSGFRNVKTGLYDVDYDFKFLPNWLKPLAKKIVKNKLFWPMIKVIAIK